MKRVLLLAAMVVLSGCATYKSLRTPVTAPAPGMSFDAQPAMAPMPPASGNQVERVPFRMGVSSATVENLAKAQSCTSAQGAALVTEPGPVEVYRVQCENGKVFMARCELRQCKKM